MAQSDLDQLLVIEKAVNVAPWTAETFQTCFQSGFSGWVIEIEKKIIGFVIVSFTLDECHILNLCVEKQYHRQGIGRKLLVHALDSAKGHGSNIAYLEVRRTNVGAIALYIQMHFQLIGERKGYYPCDNGVEDALIFAINLRERKI